MIDDPWLKEKLLKPWKSAHCSNIIDRQSVGWHAAMRAKLIRHYQGQGMSNSAISKHVSADLLTHFLDKVYTAVISNSELELLQVSISIGDDD